MLLCSFASSISLAQVDTSAQNPIKLILVDGSEFIGTIVGENETSVIFKTLGNISITLLKEQIKAVEPLAGQVIDGKYYRPDPHHTRLFFTPTARPLKSGQGYISAYQIFFPFLAFGVTDFLTLGGGLALLPRATDQIFYFAPKVTPLQFDNFSFAGGALYINSTSTYFDGLGIIYGATTYGTLRAGVTAGLGWGFLGDEIAEKPIVMLGGELRASNSIKLITENWIPSSSKVTFLSLGVRFFGDYLAADLALVYPAGSEMPGFPFFPWLGFSYNIGATK